MKNRNVAIFVLLFSFPQIAPLLAGETIDQQIRKYSRQLERLPAHTSDLRQVLPIFRHLVRLDPEHAVEYFRKALRKIEPTSVSRPNAGKARTNSPNFGSLSAAELATMSLDEIIFATNALQIIELEANIRRLQAKIVASRDNVDFIELQQALNKWTQLVEAQSNFLVYTRNSLSTLVGNLR